LVRPVNGRRNNSHAISASAKIHKTLSGFINS
jgi:hypothetical protein